VRQAQTVLRTLCVRAYFEDRRNDRKRSAAVWAMFEGYTLLAIPLFILAAEVMTVGSLTDRLHRINYVITRENIPNLIAAWFGQFNFTPNEFLLAVNVLFLILGCFVDGSAILLIVVPILLPTVKALGIDFVHFGIVAVVNCMIGLLTPPFGLLLFVMQSITRLPMRDIVRELVPFLIALIGALGLITYVPSLVLWVPRLLGYKG
jgi:C4-dicarboxylate transporter, DctM subunit